MWTVIDGFDLTDLIPYDTISFSLNQNDPQPHAILDVEDDDRAFVFQTGMEVVIWDENAMPTYTFSGRSIPTVPSHNLVQLFDQSQWSLTGTISSTITSFPGLFPVQTFSNNAVGSGLMVATSYAGYVHPGQQYMLSVYATIATALTNANALLQMDFLDGSGSTLSTVSSTFASTTENKQQRVTLTGTAPAGAVTIKVSIGGTTTNATNSGTINWGTPQLEPMWFTDIERGVSYPTPDNNYYQVASYTMPDGTASRRCRIFSGIIDDYTIDYGGPSRVWHLSIAGPGAQLENGLINASFTGTVDTSMITTVVTTYFSGLVSITAPNSSSPAPIQPAITIDNMSFSDNSFREFLNSLTEQSGSVSRINQYYGVEYTPAYYEIAPFVLTDGTPDNITSFNYYDYHPESDGTQRKKKIKVTGANFIAPAITDTFSASGSTATFTLSQQPLTVTSVVSNSNSQKAFFAGTGPTLGSGGYTAKIDKTAKTLTFSFNPGAGTNNVTCTYTYETPVSVSVQDVDTSADAVVPAYAMPLYEARINDSNLTSITAATQRGLAEITRSSRPKGIIRLSTNQFATPGTTIYFTDSLSGILNQPYTVQQVDASYLGGGVNKYAYQLGAYQPTLVDHVRNANKASNRSKTTANITAPQQIDIVASETILFSDSISATVQPGYSTGVYGTARYGQVVYGGTVGLYGSTAQYGVSTVYG